MSKFDEKIKQLRAAGEVASTVEYYLKSCEDDAEEYLTRAREAAVEADCETEFIEDDYRLENARNYQQKAAIWKAIMAYLEKQYL